MKRETAEAAMKRYGSLEKAAVAKHCTTSEIREALGQSTDNRPTKAANQPTAGAALSTLRGFTVGEATRVSAKKPTATIRARFYQLKRGAAFKLADAASEWCVSADTLRKHAQDAGCFRYVEIGNEVWEPCIMHPDTAALYPVK